MLGLLQQARELFDKLTDRHPFTTLNPRTHSSGNRSTLQVDTGFLSWRQILSPLSLGLIGLAIAVVLWGTAYKLSLYHRQTAPSSQVQVAKLWIEPRADSVSAICKLSPASHLVHAPQAYAAAPLRFAVLDCPAIIPPVRRLHGIISFDFLIPLRSPPISTSRLV